jgi:cysteine desulfurase
MGHGPDPKPQTQNPFPLWGNPSSIHHVGRRARSALDDFRDRAARVFGSKPSEVIFTSGGTEANNLALLGTARLLKSKGRHLITSAIEHHAVLHCFESLARKEGFELTLLPVDAEGRVSVNSLKAALRPDTILVSVMAANNEIGTLQPVAELGALCRERGVMFHTDAAQWFGKEPFADIHQFNADLVTLCAHKFHGPKGAGTLFIRSPLLPEPILLGGGHENERRAGTENLAAIAGLVTALENFVKPPVFPHQRMNEMTTCLSDSISHIPGARLVGPKQVASAILADIEPGILPGGLAVESTSASRLPKSYPAASGLPGGKMPPSTSAKMADATHSRLANTISFVVEDTDSFALLAGLDVEGVCASAGAACSAGSLEPSHVVSALGLPKALARSLVRFSLGRETTIAEVQRVIELLPGIVRRAQTRR